MKASYAEGSIQLWNETAVELLVARLERCGAAISELGQRGATSSARAKQLAASLRSASNALSFVDAEDLDALVTVTERLDSLERESEGLMALWQDDDSTHLYDEGMRILARQFQDDERTRVRPRIVPPTRALLRRA